MLYDQYGQPLASSRETQIKGGWIESPGIGEVSSFQPSGISRDAERTAARAAFFLNPLLSGAIDVIASFVVGDGISYGELDDESAQTALDEFWQANDLENMAERWLYEYLIDGENLTLWPTENIGGGPANIGFFDVAQGFTLETQLGLPNHITEVKIDRTAYEAGQFRWTAHRAFWNDPRGWPVVMQAVPASLAYVNFVNSRIRIHKIASRINAVYKAFLFSTTPTEKLKEQKDKADTFGKIPKDGNVLTIGKDPTSGQAEEFELLANKVNAQDSSEDGRLIRLLVAVALGIPEHYLGQADDVNYSTSQSMATPAKKGFAKKQGWLKRWLTSIFRTELVRRNGKDKTYAVRHKTIKGGVPVIETNKSPAHLLEPNWLFPTIDDDNLEAIVGKVKLAAKQRFASQQTLAGELGYDYAAELERMASDESEDNTNDTDAS